VKGKPVGILDKYSRAKENIKLIKQVIHALQHGNLVRTRDLNGAYNLNIMLTTTTGQYVLRTPVQFLHWVLSRRDELADLFNIRP
jgi:hypothetical protein